MRKLLALFLMVIACGIGYAADQNLTQKTADVSPSGTDIMYTVKDPGGTPLDRKVTIDSVLYVGSKTAVINQTPLDASGLGTMVTMTYGETLAVGDPVYYKSDGKVWKADANGTSTYPVMGICLAAGSTSGNILLHGFVRLDSWSGWTVGGTVYLSTSAGLTQTQPTATDDVIQVLGVATASKVIYFSPSLTYITHT
jgi:hypothetical protein